MIEAAVVARGTVWFFDDLGSGSSSQAEWQALLAALALAQTLEVPAFELIGDSANVIAQANGRAKCRSVEARACFAAYAAAAAVRPPSRLRWISRSQNLAGIALARRRAGNDSFVKLNPPPG